MTGGGARREAMGGESAAATKLLATASNGGRPVRDRFRLGWGSAGLGEARQRWRTRRSWLWRAESERGATEMVVAPAVPLLGSSSRKGEKEKGNTAAQRGIRPATTTADKDALTEDGRRRCPTHAYRGWLARGLARRAAR